MDEGSVGAIWQLAIHIAVDRIRVAGELLLEACGGLPLRRSAIVRSPQGVIELLDSWFSVHGKSQFRVVITGERAVPAEYATHSRNLALQFVLSNLVKVFEDGGPQSAAAE